MNKRSGLALTVIISLAIYIVLAFWFPLIPHASRLPLSDIRTFAPTGFGAVIYAVLLATLFLLQWRAYRTVSANGVSLSLATILIVGLLLALPLVLTYPINANDLFRYFIRSRQAVVYSANPFQTPLNAFSQDPFLPFAGEWADSTTPYGPLFNMISIVLVKISLNNLTSGLIVFKFFGVLLHLLSAVVIWHALAAQSTVVRSARTLLWAWNPALLLTFVMDGHNDVLMILLLLAGWLLISRGHGVLGIVVATLAVLTKASAALALPFLFLAAWRRLPALRPRLRFALLAVAGSISLTILAFLPFGSPLELVRRLVDESSSGPAFSPRALVFLLLSEEGLTRYFPWVNPLFTLLLAAGVILLLAWALSGRGRSLAAISYVNGLYLLTAARFRIWYASWIFPWTLLDESDGRSSRQRLAAAYFFLFITQLSVLIYGQARVLVLGGSQLWAHLTAIPLVFLLPWLVGRAAASRSHGRQRRG